MVLPQNWDVHQDSLGLRVAARGRPGARLRAVILVWCPNPAPDEQKLKLYTATAFQNLPAYERCRVLGHNTFDEPAVSEYELFFERDGVWWSVNFLLQQEIPALPSAIRAYLDTITINPPHDR